MNLGNYSYNYIFINLHCVISLIYYHKIMAKTASTTNSKESSAKASPFSNRMSDSKAKMYDLSQITVLLVEDSGSMQALISSMLRAFGVGDVLVANSGNEAQGLITITQSRKKSSGIKGIDVVLTDLIMPDGSGIELLEWLRANDDDEIRFLPTIMISAHSTNKIISQARDYGANESLVKPVSGGKLAERILSLIDSPRPFIKAPNFFGPDRRRKELPFKGEDRRVLQAEEIKVHHERI